MFHRPKCILPGILFLAGSVNGIKSWVGVKNIIIVILWFKLR